MDFKSRRDFVAYFSSQLPKLIPEINIYTSSEYLEQDVQPENNPTDFLFIAGKGNKSRIFFCEAKLNTSKASIHSAIETLSKKFYSGKPQKFYPLIIAPYITLEGRSACIERNVGYVDLQGNCRFKIGRFRVDRTVYSDTAERKGHEYKKTASIFSSKSSRVARLLLQAPGVWLSINEIADKTNLNKSTVYRTLSDFDTIGYTEKERGRSRLVEPGKLLEQWAKEYDYRHNKIFRFFSFAKSTEEQISSIEAIASLVSGHYALTMHAGASLVAPFVRFTNIHLYVETEESMNEFVKNLDLRPSESGGNIIFLIPYDEGVFIGSELRGKIIVASRIQLYLDLMSYPARGKEQAEFLRKQAISF